MVFLGSILALAFFIHNLSNLAKRNTFLPVAGGGQKCPICGATYYGAGPHCR